MFVTETVCPTAKHQFNAWLNSYILICWAGAGEMRKGSALDPLRNFKKNIRKPQAVYCSEFALQTQFLRTSKPLEKGFGHPIRVLGIA